MKQFLKKVFSKLREKKLLKPLLYTLLIGIVSFIGMLAGDVINGRLEGTCSIVNCKAIADVLAEALAVLLTS